jgi:hypothetical protein
MVGTAGRIRLVLLHCVEREVYLMTTYEKLEQAMVLLDDANNEMVREMTRTRNPERKRILAMKLGGIEAARAALETVI